jgi:predicted transcriptional regulator
MPEKETDIMQDLFLREKPVKIILGLKSTKDQVYATILSKYANCTYSHTIKILGLFEKAGMVKFEKMGRIKKVELTNDGWDIAHNLEAVIKKLAQIEENLKKKPAEKKKEPEKKK